MDDFRGDHSGQLALEETFGLIEKVKHAVAAKAGKVRSFTFDATPTKYDNPDGCIASLIFDVVTPYECEAELTMGLYVVNNDGSFLQNRVAYTTVDMKITT